MKTNPFKLHVWRLLMLLAVVLPGVTTAQETLQTFIDEGLRTNAVLQQKNISLKQAELSLTTARSYFLPSVNLLADYTSGEGGRSIAIPVGDLLNPVYTTLNQMTGSDGFPQIDNVNQNFFPKNFYDARIRTTLPIINTDLYINQNVQGQKVMLQQYEVELYKRQLVMDIKVAYYNILSAQAAVDIYENAFQLVARNLEVNKSLQRNGKALPAQVLRSESELEAVKAQRNSARNVVVNAKRYLNFLLNRNLDGDIAISNSLEEIAESPEAPAVEREELSMLKSMQEIQLASLRMNRLSRIPKVNAFLDLGSQAQDWKFNANSRYYLVGVQFSMPIFNGFRTQHNIRQSKYDLQKTSLQLSNTMQQLELTQSVARNDLATTRENLKAAETQLAAAQSYYNLLDRGYREGINPLIEYLDARNQLTSSQLQRNLRQLEVLTAAARLERENASYTLGK